jgi:hypothetical protein
LKKAAPAPDAEQGKKASVSAEAEEGTEAELPPVEKPFDHHPNKHTHPGAKKKKST